MIEPNEHVLDYLDGYLHHILSHDDVELLEKHCRSCRICQVALEQARKRFDAMQTLPVVEASEQLLLATKTKIERHRHRRRTALRRGGLVAFVSILILAGVHIYYATLSPSVYDLKVLGQKELIAGSDASLRIVLVNHQTGKALKNVPVDVSLTNEKTNDVIQLARFTTNDLGSAAPRFRLPDWKEGEYKLQICAYPNGSSEVVANQITLKRSWRLMLSTDKPVYQPGQVINIRSLALAQPNLKPVAGHEAEYSITDPKGNVIFRQRDVTSRFGIASAQCPLAEEIIQGAYRIQCKIGDTESAVTVEVKKYVLPKFKIDADLDRPYYQPGEKAKGTVKVDYFFGKPVTRADVAVEIRSTDVQPTTAKRLNVQTDEKGQAEFEFNVPPWLAGREQSSGDATITVEMSVSDAAGQKQSKMLSRTVTTQPIRVEVIPELGTLVENVPNRVYFFTSYPDGRPAQSRISVTEINEELLTNPLGVATLTFTPQRKNYAWTVRATDQKGQIGRREINLACGTAANDFLARTDKSVYDGGQTMHVLLLGGGKEPVFLDLLKDGQTILTDQTPIANGRGEYQFDLPPELFGTLELCAYRFSAEGLPVKKNAGDLCPPGQ